MKNVASGSYPLSFVRSLVRSLLLRRRSVAGHGFSAGSRLPVGSSRAACTAISCDLFSRFRSFRAERRKHSSGDHRDLLGLRINPGAFFLLQHAVEEAGIQSARAKVGIAQDAAEQRNVGLNSANE